MSYKKLFGYNAISITFATAAHLLVLSYLIYSQNTEEYAYTAITLIFLPYTDLFYRIGAEDVLLHNADKTLRPTKMPKKMNSVGSLFSIIATSALFIYSYVLGLDPAIAICCALTLLIRSVVSGYVANYRSWFRGNLRNEEIALNVAISSILYLIFVIALQIIFGSSELTLAIGLLFNNLVSYLHFRLKHGQVEELTDEISGALNQSIVRASTAAINQLATRVDVLLIGLTLGSDILSVYSKISTLILQPVQRIAPLLGQFLYPVLVKRDYNLISKSISLTIKLSILISGLYVTAFGLGLIEKIIPESKDYSELVFGFTAVSLMRLIYHFAQPYFLSLRMFKAALITNIGLLISTGVLVLITVNYHLTLLVIPLGAIIFSMFGLLYMSGESKKNNDQSFLGENYFKTATYTFSFLLFIATLIYVLNPMHV